MIHVETGDSYHSLMFSYMAAHNAIFTVVSEESDAIINEYAMEDINLPTEEEV